MGKSDNIIFKEYKSVLNATGVSSFGDVAYLGFSKENNFTQSISAKNKKFYDISLDNWDINTSWSLNQKFDLIVSTRCPYFSKDPNDFMLRIKNHLNKGGHALVDWGLGDHWRFKDYKIGWMRYGELEFAYKPGNYLYSCYWHDDLLKDENVLAFWNSVLQNPEFGYTRDDNLKDVVKNEIHSLINYDVKSIKTVFLWPERPQLYIITLVSES